VVVLGNPAVLAGLARQQVPDAVPVGVRNRMARSHNELSVAGVKGRRLPGLSTCCPHELKVAGIYPYWGG
jgi:hypothetical protein